MKSPFNFKAVWRIAFLVLLLPVTSAFCWPNYRLGKNF